MNNTHCSSKVFASSQIMIGKFFLSLYVGRMTEYLWVSSDAGIIRERGEVVKDSNARLHSVRSLHPNNDPELPSNKLQFLTLNSPRLYASI